MTQVDATGMMNDAATGTRWHGAWWKTATGLLMAAAILTTYLWLGPVRVPVECNLSDATGYYGRTVALDVLDGAGHRAATAGQTYDRSVEGHIAAAGRNTVTLFLPNYTMDGHGAKVVIFHVPCAWLACLAYLVAAWYAVKYLRTRAAPAAALDDLKCAAAMELGLVFAFAATVTGSIFAHNEWGTYWNWDPRETSIVVILLLFAAYLVLRGAIENRETRATLSSVYAVLAVVPAIFLIWVLPRIVGTLHGDANQGVVGGGLGGHYRIVMYGLALPAFIGLFVWLFQLRVRLLKLEHRGE